MSAASPATQPSPNVRRPAAAAARAPATATVATPSATDFSYVRGADEGTFKLNLGDIPRMEMSMDVEGLKPTLLSRLFDLVAPLSKR